MPNMEQQFRTAAFGGYQKQDVLNYIDTASKEQRSREEALRKELDEEKKARAALQKERDELSARKEALEDEGKAHAAELAERRAALEAREKRLAALERECAALETERDALRVRLTKAEPAAEAYEAVKDRTAGLELEAHHRAREAEDAAHERVKRTEAEVEAWLAKVHARYDALRTDIAATGAHAAGELKRLAGLVEQLSAGFDGQDEKLEGFARLCREAEGPLPPTPLPLGGE